MSSTLKELYAQKKLQEALDPQKMQQMVQTIGTLENMIAPIKNKVPQMAAAINQAKELAAQKLSGEGGLWNKIAGNVNDKFKIVDDLKDFITFESSMLQGFRAMPSVVSLLQKMNIDTKSKGANDQPLATQFQNNPQNRMQIVKALTNAFTPPGGIFGNKKVPFVKDIGVMASEIFNLTPNELNQLATRAKGTPGLPISSQDAKSLMSSNNQQAANQLAAGTEDKTTGKDASGQSTGVAPSQASTTGVAAGQPQTGQKTGAKNARGAKPTGGTGKFPEFQSAMTAIGAKNLADPANKRTIDQFKRFYDYLLKNAK